MSKLSNDIAIIDYKMSQYFTAKIEESNLLIGQKYVEKYDSLITLIKTYAKDNKIRLTCDVRFQPKNEPKDPRYFGLNPGGTTGAGYGELNSARPLNENWHNR
mgnify:CR=1 FL=1